MILHVCSFLGGLGHAATNGIKIIYLFPKKSTLFIYLVYLYVLFGL